MTPLIRCRSAAVARSPQHAGAVDDRPLLVDRNLLRSCVVLAAVVAILTEQPSYGKHDVRHASEESEDDTGPEEISIDE